MGKLLRRYVKYPHPETVQRQEAVIEHNKNKLSERMDNDIAKLDILNKILSNGITLTIYKATGHK